MQFDAHFARQCVWFYRYEQIVQKVIDKATVCNYKKETLEKCLLGVDYEAHISLSDVTSLRSLRKLSEKKLAKLCDSSDVFAPSYYSVKALHEPIGKKKLYLLSFLRFINCLLSLSKLTLIY